MKADRHAPKERPHECRLPVSGPASELHDALSDLPGFAGITCRDDAAGALFTTPPLPDVEREAARRARLAMGRPRRNADLTAPRAHRVPPVSAGRAAQGLT